MVETQKRAIIYRKTNGRNGVTLIMGKWEPISVVHIKKKNMASSGFEPWNIERWRRPLSPAHTLFFISLYGIIIFIAVVALTKFVVNMSTEMAKR